MLLLLHLAPASQEKMPLIAKQRPPATKQRASPKQRSRSPAASDFGANRTVRIRLLEQFQSALNTQVLQLLDDALAAQIFDADELERNGVDRGARDALGLFDRRFDRFLLVGVDLEGLGRDGLDRKSVV